MMKCLLAVCMGGASALAPRIARASLRVSDAAKAGAWYADCFGLSVRNTPGVAEVEFGATGAEFALSLREECGAAPIADDSKSVLGIGIEVRDAAALAAVCLAQAAVSGEAAVVPAELSLTASTVPDEDPYLETLLDVADFRDAAGYRVRAMTTASAAGRALVAPKLVLCVSDLDASVKFYSEALGMRVLRRRALIPLVPAQTALLGYSTADDDAIAAAPECADDSAACRLELRYMYNNDQVDCGVGLDTLVVLTDDVAQCAANAPLHGGKADLTEHAATITDPDGYKIIVTADLAHA